MFNDRYGLTEAVLEGRKTMTRRIAEKNLVEDMDGELCWDGEFKKPKYKVGEVVAVAQSYEDAGYDPHMLQFLYLKKPKVLPFCDDRMPLCGYVEAPIMYHAGWKNKMFVFPTMMPHQIRITNVKVERLQDISDEDCMREGISFMPGGYYVNYRRGPLGRDWLSDKSYRSAFAALIDKMCGKGTWEANPWVYVYEFELVK